MTVNNWDERINTRFYGLEDNHPKNNTQKTSYLSGRVSGIQINTRAVMQKTVKLRLTKAEETLFWQWYNDIGGDVGAFTCDALGTGYWLFSEMPEPVETTQTHVVLSMTIEEVY